MTQSFKYSIPRIVISALRGGSGKTILSLCLIAVWHKKGLSLTPFKKGPDYIDAGWLAYAAREPCYNLDLFLMQPQQILQSFVSHTNPPLPPFTKGGIIALIEGNRGLYDGVDPQGTYSTAELAKLLHAPVIMIVDCTKATSTVAAMVLGCQKLDSKVLIKGVVLNRIATSRQESLIRTAISQNCNLPVLGAIPALKKDLFPERHMGLTPFQEHAEVDRSISNALEIAEKYLDLDGIWKIANEAAPIIIQSTEHSLRRALRQRAQGRTAQSSRAQNTGFETRNSKPAAQNPQLRIGVIKDSAFQFYYPENFEELRNRGINIREISALKEKELPELDGLYIGGGFPETHAIALAENISFKNSLCKAVERGLPVYAECGGLMYLGKSLILKNKTYPMAGVLPAVFGLERKPQAHGYTIIEVERSNPYFPVGCILKGHEFHYSRILDIKENNTYMAFKVKRGQGIKNNKDGLCYKNVLATYTHLHALGAGEWVDGLIKCAAQFRLQEQKLD